jgi:hypothetical protein
MILGTLGHLSAVSSLEVFVKLYSATVPSNLLRHTFALVCSNCRWTLTSPRLRHRLAARCKEFRAVGVLIRWLLNPVDCETSSRFFGEKGSREPTLFRSVAGRFTVVCHFYVNLKSAVGATRLLFAKTSRVAPPNLPPIFFPKTSSMNPIVPCGSRRMTLDAKRP